MPLLSSWIVDDTRSKSLTLGWHSFLGGGSDMVIGSFAYKGGKFCQYGLMLMRSLVIMQDARPEIGDTPLTLISLMGQRAWFLPLYIESRPITPLRIAVTIQHFDCRKDQTRIVDTPLTLTSVTYQHPFGGQSFCLNVIPSLLTANIQLVGRIFCIQKHQGLSVSEQPLLTSGVRWMTLFHRV